MSTKLTKATRHTNTGILCIKIDYGSLADYLLLLIFLFFRKTRMVNGFLHTDCDPILKYFCIATPMLSNDSGGSCMGLSRVVLWFQKQM